MEIRRRVAALIVCVGGIALHGAGAQLADPLTQPGWQHFYNNEFDAAVADFQQETGARSDDPDGWDHLAQAILYREMYRNGALESQLVSGTNPFLRRAKFNVTPQVRADFRAAIEKAMALGETALARNPSDTHALYALSVAHGLRANYLFLVEKAWIDALHDASASSRYSNRLVEVDPNFVDSNIVQGVQNYVVGNLPQHWKLLGFLIGFHGDRELGIRQLQLVAERGVLSKYDARILLAAIYRRERRSQDAIPLLKNLAELFPRNYLFRLEQVQMYSDMGKKDEALAALADVDRLRQEGQPGYKHLPVEKLNYIRGNLLFWYDDLGGALTNLREAAQHADQLDLGTAQLAWFRLGQTLDLMNRHEEAVPAYREASQVEVQSDIGAEAKHYISNPYHRKRTHQTG
jgi:tetratricopeptide (TPR) repeat protein